MNTANITAQSNIFTDQERELLACIVEFIIPCAPDQNLPGAGDLAILEDIVTIGKNDLPSLKKAISEFDTLASGLTENLNDAAKAEVINSYRLQCSRSALFLQTITATAYYRDARVLEHIGVEARPPFPKGYHVEQSDLTLLDPVRKRGPIFVMPD